MLPAAFTVAATVAEESSKAPFYIAGCVLAAFAVLVGGLGVARHATFPPSPGGMRAVIGLTALLVIATMATAILSS